MVFVPSLDIFSAKDSSILVRAGEQLGSKNLDRRVCFILFCVSCKNANAVTLYSRSIF